MHNEDIDNERLRHENERLKHEELPENHEDVLVQFLHRAIRIAVKLLAVLMVMVIFWSVVDVIYVIYSKLIIEPLFMIVLEDVLVVFGAIMIVLIGVEIFINIRLYLGSNIIPVQLVLATALMAVARKVIVLDLSHVTSEHMVGIALITLALGISYWLVAKKTS